MYSKTSNAVIYHKNDTAPHTESCTYAKVTVSIKDKDDNLEYDMWNARFVGKAAQKAAELKENDHIVLTSWIMRNKYNKEKNTFYPYILVMEFSKAKGYH